jgi:hypothetical protein
VRRQALDVRVHRLYVFTPDEIKLEEESARTGARRSRRFTIRIASGVRLSKRHETLRAEAE